MTFCFHQGGVVMSSQITYALLSNFHHLAHIPKTVDIIQLATQSSICLTRIQYLELGTTLFLTTFRNFLISPSHPGCSGWIIGLWLG